MTQKDDIYAQYRDRVADFKFDDKVVAVFDDMIRRTVPGYGTVIAMTKVFAEHYAQADSVCYDLGCSLGTSTLAMRHGIHQANCRIVAVDNSPPMIQRCGEIMESDVHETPVELLLADIQDVPIEKASMVVMNFTLQFLAPEARDRMIQRLYDGMLPGGVLLLSEKITFEDARLDAFQTDMHHEYKRLMDYSQLEISQKRKALEKVLLPDSLATHQQRLRSAGFEKVNLWFQCFNFVSMAAFKS